MTTLVRLVVGLMVVLLLAACTQIPEDFGRSPSAGGGGGSPAVSASPGITIDGATVTIVGVGASKSDLFDLPAGAATVAITACTSNQVMPFITLLSESGQSAGLIVDPEKVLNGLAGGKYYVQAQTNPDCVWQVRITPG